MSAFSVENSHDGKIFENYTRFEWGVELGVVAIFMLRLFVPHEFDVINFMHLERINANMISRKILESLSDPSISLDPSNIRGQAYDGASVMSSGKEGVQAKIKEISPLALFTHCYAHCLNLSIAASCKLSASRSMQNTLGGKKQVARSFPGNV